MKGINDPAELWLKQKARLKFMFKEIQDEDLHYDYGRKEEMMTNLQLKLGKSRKELNDLLIGL